MGTQFCHIWPKLFVSSCGKSKGSHPRGAHNVPMCSPLGRRAKGPPSLAEFNGHTNHTRFMPDSYPNHAPPHSLPPIPHPGCFGGACRGPLESLVEECICLVCPASNRCCLPTASAQSGPTAGSPANPTIQLQSCESSANHMNHTLESYPRIIPRIIPPIQTSRPDYGEKIHVYIYIYKYH